ncbi:MAG: type II-A CRISPR-associated protein Csn2 [Clostridia bacterium]
MKINISGIEKKIDLENNINVLEIEDKNFIKKFITELNYIINNNIESENIILEEENNILKFSNNAMIIFDIFNIDFNSKTILNKLYNKTNELVKLDDKVETEYKELIQKLIIYITDKLNELPFEYDLNDDIIFKDLLKTFSVKINADNYYLPEEKIMFLIDLVSEFKITNILIFINIKNYFEKSNLEEIYKYAMYKEIKLLLIENNTTNEILKYENKLYKYTSINNRF